MSEKHSILVVDDDEAIRYGTFLRLDMNGYSVSTAIDGGDGIKQARTLKPDLILMDIRMPNMDGLTALKNLKADSQTAEIPVVMASASPGDQTNALDSGAKYFLRKPYSNESLIAAIESGINKATPH